MRFVSTPRRQSVAVIAVVGNYVVSRQQGGKGADGDGLLADIEVQKAANVARRVVFGASLFESTDEVHLAIQRQ